MDRTMHGKLLCRKHTDVCCVVRWDWIICLYVDEEVGLDLDMQMMNWYFLDLVCTV